ncbi:5378_t:CDS:1 [Entrophospora sp. SA101]|nr:5378_t:CDS:1 [Entrophospora sp. SA101]
MKIIPDWAKHSRLGELSQVQSGPTWAPELMFYAKYLLKKFDSRIAIVVIRTDYKEWYKELNSLLTQIEALSGEYQVFCLSETSPQDIINFNLSGWANYPKLGHI